MDNLWFTKSIEAVLTDLDTSPDGLTSVEAKTRLLKYGENKLPETKSDSLMMVFFHQFQSPLIYILFAAAIITFFLKEFTDGGLILFVLFFNAVVGTIQEGKAQNTLLALKNFTTTKATVLRDNSQLIVPDSELVIGDIICLSEGEKIPADARLINSSQLRLDESSLTGESAPVDKTVEMLENVQLPISDQTNTVFKGTNISAGHGLAVVVSTGLDTYIGKISQEIFSIDTEIPLKKNIRRLSQLIILAVIVVATLVFILGIIRGNTISEMFRMVISLAVSMIPEGLPIVLTLILASGVWRMGKKNALVKKLQAVETLGQTQVIALDKTGTLTKNEQIIQRAYVDEKIFSITGEGYEPKGDASYNEKIIQLNDSVGLNILTLHALLSSGANLTLQKERWQISGDPTEAAMLVFANKLGLKKDDVEKEFLKINEVSFDYKFKLHAVVNEKDAHKIITVTGAPEEILRLSQKIWHSSGIKKMDQTEIRKLESVFQEMSKEGLRVIAVAISDDVPKDIQLDKIDSLTFLGFVGMKDALRSEVYGSIKKAQLAGIKMVMITGDHPMTARAIASEAGIFHEGDSIVTGDELKSLSEAELSRKLHSISVFARVTPEDKLRIIKAFKAQGKIIAMTGDGVNDAPSLVAADLGVAMGRIGTEVSKEAADIVLLDDNLNSIISAVEEGRSIYKTIKKVILYLFSTNMGEVLVIVSALVLGWMLPILPAQIIWLNLVTDGFLDVALSTEPKEPGLLRNKFKKSGKYLVDSLMLTRMLLMSIPMAIGTLILFQIYYQTDIVRAWTMSLTALAVFQWFSAYNCRSEDKSIFQMKFFSNKLLIGATIIVVSLQFLAVYNPLMQKILHTTALSLYDWLMILAVGLSIIFVEEIRKWFYRKSL